MDKPVTIGVHILRIGLNFSQVKKICKSAESLGFDSITLMDHFRPFFPPKYRDLLECWTTLGGLSAETRKIRIGSLVTCASYRNPALLAKMAASLDNMSQGRLKFGIGSGSLLDEFEEHGVTLDKSRERIRRLEEAIQIIKKCGLKRRQLSAGNIIKLLTQYATPSQCKSHILQ